MKVLCNVATLTVGVDLPITSCIILARSIGTQGLYLQICGRGLRLYPGKVNCIIGDLHGVSYDLGRPEDEREYSLEGNAIRLKGEDDEVVTQSYCRVCKMPIEPGEVCASCGTPPKEIPIPEVTGDKIVKYAAKRAEGPDKRRSTLLRWVQEAIIAGHKPAKCKYKYDAVYNEHLPWDQLSSAVREVNARIGKTS